MLQSKAVLLIGYQYPDLELNHSTLQYTSRGTRDGDTLALLISLYAHPLWDLQHDYKHC